uniref:ParB-like nuclease n=1 Tax=Desulfovibrio sp. U5L TaxID=596152 RepID=I2PXP7_9BACT
MQTLFLHPRDVDTTPAHLFWSAPPDEALVASLTRFGQATPALVAVAEGRPVLVAGSRRTLALREMRGRTLAAVAVDLSAVAAPEADVAAALPLPVRLGLAYLASNLGRPVTDAMAVAAGRYFTALGPVEDFLALAGPQLFAPADRRALLVSRWLGLPAALDGLLASGHVPLGAAALLAGLDPDTLARLTPLLGAVRWSRANLDNALTWLVEAARIAGERPAALLARSGVLDLPGRGLSPNDLAAGILAGLRRIRYPATTTLEARFAALSRKLLAGSRVKIRPSQGFESDAVTVEVLVKSPADLSRAAADMAAMAASPELPKLLAVARDEDPA